MSQYIVSTFYKFINLPDFATYRAALRQLMEQHGVKGTILLAAEGVNGTIAGSRAGIDHVVNWLQHDTPIGSLPTKESFAEQLPFRRTSVKLKKEIVTMGVAGIDPTKDVGIYVPPKAWNALISDPDVLLIDTRNTYETKVGTFKNAVDPRINSFRELPAYMDEQLATKKPKKVAMFCTGGIRCEKSTAYLRAKGFEQVYHLEGGILKYLEEIAEDESLWEGECFVFDERVAVNQQLEKGSYVLCYGCQMPLNAEELASDKYELGVSCPYCYDQRTDEQKASSAERRRQMQLAQARNEQHIGSDTIQTAKQRRAAKHLLKNQQRNKTDEV
ncbi:MAG TPA: rhodanese-related sulfurtransferase [Anaerolineae bacterium]|nr:rhodanese-related sulfurtransferase [Anaerolineae bacterium]